MGVRRLCQRDILLMKLPSAVEPKRGARPWEGTKTLKIKDMGKFIDYSRVSSALFGIVGLGSKEKENIGNGYYLQFIDTNEWGDEDVLKTGIALRRKNWSDSTPSKVYLFGDFYHDVGDMIYDGQNRLNKMIDKIACEVGCLPF